MDFGCFFVVFVFEIGVDIREYSLGATRRTVDFPRSALCYSSNCKNQVWYKAG